MYSIRPVSDIVFVLAALSTYTIAGREPTPTNHVTGRSVLATNAHATTGTHVPGPLHSSTCGRSLNTTAAACTAARTVVKNEWIHPWPTSRARGMVPTEYSDAMESSSSSTSDDSANDSPTAASWCSALTREVVSVSAMT